MWIDTSISNKKNQLSNAFVFKIYNPRYDINIDFING